MSRNLSNLTRLTAAFHNILTVTAPHSLECELMYWAVSPSKALSLDHFWHTVPTPVTRPQVHGCALYCHQIPAGFCLCSSKSSSSSHTACSLLFQQCILCIISKFNYYIAYFCTMGISENIKWHQFQDKSWRNCNVFCVFFTELLTYFAVLLLLVFWGPAKFSDHTVSKASLKSRQERHWFLCAENYLSEKE